MSIPWNKFSSAKVLCAEKNPDSHWEYKFDLAENVRPLCCTPIPGGPSSYAEVNFPQESDPPQYSAVYSPAKAPTWNKTIINVTMALFILVALTVELTRPPVSLYIYNQTSLYHYFFQAFNEIAVVCLVTHSRKAGRRDTQAVKRLSGGRDWATSTFGGEC